MQSFWEFCMINESLINQKRKANSKDRYDSLKIISFSRKFNLLILRVDFKKHVEIKCQLHVRFNFMTNCNVLQTINQILHILKGLNSNWWF